MRIGVFLSAALLVLSACQRGPSSAELLSDDPEVRSAALRQIENLSDRKKQPLIPPLVDVLTDLETRIVYRAIEALTLIGPSAVPPLKEALENEDVFARMSAAEILGRYGAKSQSCVSDLIKMLNDQHPLARESAAEALGRIGPVAQEALPALSTALKDKNEDVRAAVKTAVQMIKKGQV